MCVKLYKMYGIIYRTKHQLNQEALYQTLFYAYWYNLFLYGAVSGWYTWRTIFFTQKKIIWTISFEGEYDAIGNLLADLKLPILYSLQK